MFKIFKILKIGRDIEKGTFDTHNFAGKEVSGFTTGVLNLPIFIFGVIAVLLLLIGFTSFWFGPVTFLGILGIITLIPMFTLIIIKKKITHAIEEHLEE